MGLFGRKDKGLRDKLGDYIMTRIELGIAIRFEIDPECDIDIDY